MLVRLAQSRAPGEARLIARSSTCAGAAWRLFVAAIFLILSAHSGYAQLGDTCPPRGGQALMAVPTGEGLMGYLVGTTIKATNGDQVQFWCVKSNSGTDYGYLYYNNATIKYSWMGGCFFAGGQNQPSGQVTLGIVNNRVVVTGFGQQSWKNFAPPDPAKPMNQTTSDWDFKYDPATNKLTVAATQTNWQFAGQLRNPITGQVITNIFTPTGTANQAGYPITYNAPGAFDGLVDKNGAPSWTRITSTKTEQATNRSAYRRA